MRSKLSFGLILALLLTICAISVGAVVQTQRVVVGTAPTLIWTAPAGSGKILIRNPSAVSVYVGGATVATTTGFEIAAGDSLAIMLANRGTIFGVVAAATQTVYTIQGDNVQ